MNTYLFLEFFIEGILSNREKTYDRVSYYDISQIDNMADTILENLNRLIRLLEIYLHEYVERTESEYRLPDIDDLKIDHVLSFNYTDTYHKIYDKEGNAKYCFIHGKTKESDVDTCNLVLGIDEYLPEDRIDADNQFVWFKKFYQRIFKETGSEYLDWINEFQIENDKATAKYRPFTMKIYIYGHSLDVTDKDVLSKLI